MKEYLFNKNIFFTIGLFFSLTALLLAAQFNIEPGLRIGKIELGATRSQVHSLLGKPSGSYRVSAQYNGDYWQARSGNTVRIFYQNNQVAQIGVTSPSFTTANGLSSKSSLSEVKAKYPQLKRSSYFVRGSGGGLIDYYDEPQQGIAFIFTAPDSDQPQFSPYAIVVHKPGVEVIPEQDEQPRR